MPNQELYNPELMLSLFVAIDSAWYVEQKIIY